MTTLWRRALRIPPDTLLAGAAVVVVAAAILAALGLRPPDPGERAQRLAAELRCPVCQGLSIADSPAAVAVEMRQIVAEQVAAGATDEDVRAYFSKRYGPWILLAPEPSGPNLLLWAAPGLLLIGGATAVVARSRRHRDRAATRPAAGLAGSRPSPLAIGLALGIVIAAVAIPMAVAVTPRSSGQEITGRPATQAAPSIEDLVARLAADPADVGSLVALGDAYANADRSADAADAYGRALKASPDDVGALVGLGILLLEAGRPDAALALMDRATTISPALPDVHLYRAVARFQLAGGLTAEARRDAMRFLELAPSDPRRALAEQLLAAPAPSARP